jgi:hypothetical protein
MINAIGLENNKSHRKADDGFTYFGCKKSIKKGGRTAAYSSASPFENS